MKSKKLLIAFGIISAGYSAVSMADLNESANDWKGYNGAYCKAANNSLDVRYSVSGISNWENFAITIYCPIVRDSAKGEPKQATAAVRLFNNNSQKGGFCTLVSRDINNKSTVAFDKVFWDAGFNDHTIRLGPIDTNNWGSHMIYCKIPGKEGARKTVIRSISLDEKN